MPSGRHRTCASCTDQGVSAISVSILYFQHRGACACSWVASALQILLWAADLDLLPLAEEAVRVVVVGVSVLVQFVFRWVGAAEGLEKCLPSVIIQAVGRAVECCLDVLSAGASSHHRPYGLVGVGVHAVRHSHGFDSAEGLVGVRVLFCSVVCGVPEGHLVPVCGRCAERVGRGEVRAEGSIVVRVVIIVAATVGLDLDQGRRRCAGVQELQDAEDEVFVVVSAGVVSVARVEAFVDVLEHCERVEERRCRDCGVVAVPLSIDHACPHPFALLAHASVRRC
eukprot:2942662-Rhodomonas_salina.1